MLAVGDVLVTEFAVAVASGRVLHLRSGWLLSSALHKWTRCYCAPALAGDRVQSTCCIAAIWEGSQGRQFSAEVGFPATVTASLVRLHGTPHTLARS